MARRKFGAEFKTEAVKLFTERGVSVAQAAPDLDLAQSVLRRWMRELAVAPATAFPGHEGRSPQGAPMCTVQPAYFCAAPVADFCSAVDTCRPA